MDEVEARESWPVLDKALAKICAEMDARQPRRATDPADSDWTEGRNGDGAMESGSEAVTSRRLIQSEDRRVWVMWGVGLFLATIIANATVVWLIVRALEETVK
jgi:hypothetical protein